MTATSSPRVDPFFDFRTVLFPWQVFHAWGEGAEAPQAIDDLNAALARDKARLRARLKDLVTQATVRASLFLASPDLDAALIHWFENPDSEKGLRAERSLVRYFSRMCGRA